MKLSYYFVCAALLFMLHPLNCRAQAAPEDAMALIYLCDQYQVREEASGESGVVATVPGGQTVTVLDMVFNEKEGAFWVSASFYADGEERTGYIARQNLACSDERFLAWEKEYIEKLVSEGEVMLPEGLIPGEEYAAEGGLDGNGVSADIAQFPASYQEALSALKQAHPKWTFVAMETGLDWETVISNELTGGRSLVYYTLPECAKNGLYDDGKWYYASESILKYYMDPRNGLTEDAVFQFEQLTYNASYHTESAVESFLEGTFMRSPDYAPGTVMTYAHIFWAIGAEEIRKVSPFHLAARVYQEQGQGKSDLISGSYPGYEGYYNYFNVGASGRTTKEVVESGLKYAKEHDWSNAYFSILGGSNVISVNYIRKGQDTLYLQKYNVNPQGEHALYTHQYMQNISAPTTEGKSIRKLYASANATENTFVFKIPVYKNMPDSACPYPKDPVDALDVTVEIPEGYDTTLWVDGIVQKAENKNGKWKLTLPDKLAKGITAYKYDENGVPVGMYVWTLEYKDDTYIVKAQPKMKDLLSYHGFSIRVSGRSGIRFKTGISKSLKKTLSDSGVDGYCLKEYGTLVMSEENRASYPMVKGGKKVQAGMAYGVDAKGKKQDIVYEIVDGRHRFTSVLVGLPENQYRTEYAFRGYVVLEKDGVTTTLYGPIVARSICSLAEQLLNMGTYSAGSKEDAFLRQIIAVK